MINFFIGSIVIGSYLYTIGLVVWLVSFCVRMVKEDENKQRANA